MHAKSLFDYLMLIILVYTIYAAVVESLINTGKQIAAVHFIHAFQLQESFPPVPLLKAYLKNRRRNSQVKTGNVRDITSAKVCFVACSQFQLSNCRHHGFHLLCIACIFIFAL